MKNQDGSVPSAVPVQETAAANQTTPNSSVPTVQAAPIGQHHINSINAYPVNVDGTFQENERYGICRGCRRIFERSPEFHDGHVQYYRCPECNANRLSDMIAASCVVS